MSTIHLALFGILLASALLQFYLVAGFVYRLRKWRQPLLENELCPKAVVILCLRGGDPFLTKCIDGLLAQDYPDFQVRFMVDHADDPAMPILKKALADSNFERFQIEVLDSPLTTCSLKCSSLVQAIEGFPASIEMIALLDADTIPHPKWLRELATALVPKNVGAATGNRWYRPTLCGRGSMIRYIWNAAAIVQMYWYEIAWGGTLAIKMDSIHRSGMLDRWRHAYGEDTMVRTQLLTIGQKVAFVPSLMMVNREECSVSSFNSWVKRQLLAARLYHPFWLLVVGHGISSSLVLLWGIASGIALLFQADFMGAGLVFLAIFTFHVCLTSMLPWMEKAVFAIAKARGEDVSWPSKSNFFVVLWIAWVTHWTYTWALLCCLFLKRFNWRGIEYEVAGPFDIKMQGYRPYQRDDTSESREAIPHSI